MLDVRDPGLTTVFAEDAEFVLCVEFGEFCFEVLGHKGDDLVWSLGRDQSVGAGVSLFCPSETRNYGPDAEFSRNLGGDDSLGPGTVESTLDTMDGERRLPHPAHKDLDLVIRQGNGCTDGIVNVINGVVETFVKCPVDGDVRQLEAGSMNPYLSSLSAALTMSSTPGTRMVPSCATSFPKRAIRSVMGSCTVLPKTPEWRSRAGPVTSANMYARPRRPYVIHGVRVLSQ